MFAACIIRQQSSLIDIHYSKVLTRPIKCNVHLSHYLELGKRLYDEGIPFRHRGLLLDSLNDDLQVCKVQVWLFCQPKQQVEVCQPHLIWLPDLFLEVVPQLCFPCTSKNHNSGVGLKRKDAFLHYHVCKALVC